MTTKNEQITDYALPLRCRHCGAKLAHREGHGGRYRFTDNLDGTDIFGSGSECPKNERGHEPVNLNDPGPRGTEPIIPRQPDLDDDGDAQDCGCPGSGCHCGEYC